MLTLARAELCLLARRLERARRARHALGIAVTAACVALLTAPASAIDVLYEMAPIGGNAYRAEYKVVNDGSLGGAPVEWFQVDFDPALYEELSLSIDSDPSIPALGWDEVLLASGLGVPAAYDVFSDSTSIASGTGLGGFAVMFTWLGGGEGPGAQGFSVLDPGSFEIVETGVTIPVPSPGTALLFGVGLMSLGLERRRQRTR